MSGLAHGTALNARGFQSGLRPEACSQVHSLVHPSNVDMKKGPKLRFFMLDGPPNPLGASFSHDFESLGTRQAGASALYYRCRRF